jgi:hypothetical protein
VGRQAVRHMGLALAEGRDCATRCSELTARGSHAHRLDVADTGKQRVLRTVHVQHLCAESPQVGVLTGVCVCVCVCVTLCV